MSGEDEPFEDLNILGKTRFVAVIAFLIGIIFDILKRSFCLQRWITTTAP
ncbi:hypothetical protein ACFSMW_08130 [Virgibacillus halophilus]|uniref:Uncharacterized protein n=1 Tax=Tigheibacillus halophilus TaxID=361280 RepID=A0ABU5C584_9BACI|nr:hypothetical protein [Virgibacillus halophilus]